jgi:hypothetical protein
VGCNAVSLGQWFIAFQRVMMPLSLGSSSTWRMINNTVFSLDCSTLEDEGIMIF